MPTSLTQAAKFLLRDLKKSKIAVTRTGGPADTAHASPALRKIYVARRTASPLAKLAHEAGHMENPPTPKDFFAKLKARKDGDGITEAKLNLKAEHAGNKGAERILKTYGASADTIASYRNVVRPYQGTYRSGLAREYVKASGQNVFNNKALKLTKTGKKVLANASLLDVNSWYEKYRKKLIPGYEAKKSAVSVQHQAVLSKGFNAQADVRHLDRVRRGLIALARILDSAHVELSGAEANRPATNPQREAFKRALLNRICGK